VHKNTILGLVGAFFIVVGGKGYREFYLKISTGVKFKIEI
jgi:hypothetical protein